MLHLWIRKANLYPPRSYPISVAQFVAVFPNVFFTENHRHGWADRAIFDLLGHLSQLLTDDVVAQFAPGQFVDSSDVGGSDMNVGPPNDS